MRCTRNFHQSAGAKMTEGPPSPTWQCPLQEEGQGSGAEPSTQKGHKQLLTHGQNQPHSPLKAPGGREVPFYPVSGERAGNT